MATLLVWKFNDASGADQARGILERLQQRQLIYILGAATITWPLDSTAPKTKQAMSMAEAGVLSGGF